MSGFVPIKYGTKAFIKTRIVFTIEQINRIVGWAKTAIRAAIKVIGITGKPGNTDIILANIILVSTVTA